MFSEIPAVTRPDSILLINHHHTFSYCSTNHSPCAGLELHFLSSIPDSSSSCPAHGKKFRHRSQLSRRFVMSINTVPKIRHGAFCYYVPVIPADQATTFSASNMRSWAFSDMLLVISQPRFPSSTSLYVSGTDPYNRPSIFLSAPVALSWAGPICRSCTAIPYLLFARI